MLIIARSHPILATQRHAPLTPHGTLNLPDALQGPASQAIGAQDPAYSAVASAEGFRARNSAQGFSTAFARSGVTVRSGGLGLGLTLTGAGFGTASAPVLAARPQARANRVTYDHGWLQEWYVNGPVGLEQGFTVPHAPAAPASGPLQLSLSVSGGTHATELAGDKGVRFGVGHESLIYGAPTAIDARGHSLRSWLQLRGYELVLRVDTRHAVYPVHIDPFIQQGSKITAGEVGAGIFGGAVAISADGKTALVGAPNDSPHNVVREGAVWVFIRSGESWIQQGEPLTGGEGQAGYFGASVALSADGNTALVGAPGGGNKEEPAYVFTRSGSKWSLQASVKGSSETSTSNFGSGVSLSEDGNTAIVGASGEKVGAQAGAGAVYAFTRSAEKWSQQGERLTGSGENGAGSLGESVALSAEGNTAVIGAPGNAENKGAVWTFERSGGVWKQAGSKFAPKGETGEGRFGASVAVAGEGTELEGLFGAPGDNGKIGAVWAVAYESPGEWLFEEKMTGSGESGKAEFGMRVALAYNNFESFALVGGGADNGSAGATWALYDENPEVSWTQKKFTAGSEELGTGGFGGAVAISADGETGFAAAPTDDSAHFGLGAVWAYQRSGTTTWNQQGEKLTGMTELGAGEFGINTTISADGRTALVGARLANEEHGAAWVFVRSGAEWIHQAKLTGGAEEVGIAGFGKEVALSTDGNTALIGGALDEGQTGAAWVFTRSGGKWKQQGKKLVEPKTHLFGNGLALSGDGNTAVICTYENEPHEYVFTRTGEAWAMQSVITRPAGEPTASFGETATMSNDGQTLVLGSYQDHEERGGVWVFVKHNGVWTQQGPKLTGAGEKGEHFGTTALSADGSTLLVGAPGATPPGAPTGNHTGVAYVFIRTGESWALQGGELVGTGVEAFVSSFGTGVALSGDGNTALIGGGVHEGKGALWEFKRFEGSWRQVGEKIVASGQEGEAEFGNNMGLSADGTTALVAGPADASKLGAAWVFMESPSLAGASATEVTEKTAQLHATVNPQGEAVTECKFEYGTSTAYDSEASCTASPGSGTSPVGVTASIIELTPDTVYHFRLVSSNGHGVQQTEDATFTTLAEAAKGKTAEPTVPAKAETEGGGLAVEGKGGTGEVTIGAYGSNTGGADLIGAKGTYFQVYRSEGSSFTTVKYTDCELDGAKALWWFNKETGWEPIPASMAVYTAGPPACITVTATEATSPDIEQLSDPRHVGGEAMNAVTGKCEPAKGGGYNGEKESMCTTTDTVKEKAKGAGAFEWYGASSEPCFPLKKGFWKVVKELPSANGLPTSECETKDEKKELGAGKYERAENATRGTGGGIALKVSPQEAEPVLRCTGSSTLAGEFTSTHHSVETITYTGCEHHKAECQSSNATADGTVITHQLESYVSKAIKENGIEKATEKYELVLAGKADQAGAGREPFMEFECNGVEFTVTGGVEGALSGGFRLNTMAKSLAAGFEPGEGAQEMYVQEGANAPEEVGLTSSATIEYKPHQEFEIGEPHEFPEASVVELKQRIEGEKHFLKEERSAKAGQTVEYEIIVRNIGTLTRTFSLIGPKSCEHVAWTGKKPQPLAAGKAGAFTCKEKLVAGRLPFAATVEGSQGFGKHESNKLKINVQ